MPPLNWAHTLYGPMRLALYRLVPELTILSAPRLPGNRMGVYDDARKTILIDRRLTYTQKRCALVHELVHWSHGDNRCGLNERRTRLETARLLVDEEAYRKAETMYDTDIWQIAGDLNVTMQVIRDWQEWRRMR